MKTFHLNAPITLSDETPVEGQPAKKVVTVEGYSGDKVEGWFEPIVVDLTGMSVEDERMPFLLEHKRECVAGQVREYTKDAKLSLKAELWDTPSAQTLRQAAENKFEYQASMGFEVGSYTYVPAKQTVQVNGRQFTGPITVIATSVLKEMSAVLWGRDPKTSCQMSKELEMELSARPAELSELRGKFSDAAFVLEAIDNKWSLPQAAEEWYNRKAREVEIERAKLAEERTRLASQPAPAPTPAPAPLSGADPIRLTDGAPPEGHLPAPYNSITFRAAGMFPPCAEPFTTHDDMKYYREFGKTAVVKGQFNEDPSAPGVGNFSNVPW